MTIDDILKYTRQYLGKGLSWENSVCLPQENLPTIRKCLGGINLALCDSIDSWKENRTHNLFWIDPDTQETFNEHKNDPQTRKCLEQFNWIRTDGSQNAVSVQYLLNDQGYRIDHGYDEDGIIFYGCSFTFGIGLDKEHTFTEIVSKELGLANFNFGIPGVGLDASVIHALFLLKHTVKKPKAMVVFTPPPRRWNYFNGSQIVTTSSQQISKYRKITEEYVMSMEYQCVTDDMNNLIQTTKNIMVLRDIAKELDIPFVLADYSKDFDREFKAYHYWKHCAQRGDESFDGVSMARDLIHPGEETNAKWAEIIIKLIKEKL
jgi:hypothetical protein